MVLRYKDMHAFDNYKKKKKYLQYVQSRQGRNTSLSSPHPCFIIVFNGDLFVSRDDPLMS